MSYEIYRNRVSQYNSGGINIPASREFNVRYNVLETAVDYTAVIESASVDLSLAPLDPAPQYEIMVYCDLKDGTKPPGLEYGPNYFKLTEPLTSVEQFLKFLQDALFKAPHPFNLGLFGLNNSDFFTYDIRPEDYTASFGSGAFEVYFNSPLVPIMTGFVNTENPTEIYGQLFYKMTPKSGHTESTTDTMYRLNKMDSIMFYTTLPITETEVLDHSLGEATRERILGTIEVNPLLYNIRTKSDWRYTPTVLRHYTMNQHSPVQNYSVWTVIRYINGLSRAHVLKPGERFAVNIAYFPLKSVEVG